eukprot:2020159-Prymnesium_polylepis.1
MRRAATKEVAHQVELLRVRLVAKRVAPRLVAKRVARGAAAHRRLSRGGDRRRRRGRVAKRVGVAEPVER